MRDAGTPTIRGVEVAYQYFVEWRREVGKEGRERMTKSNEIPSAAAAPEADAKHVVAL